MERRITDEHLPGTYQSADKTAKNAQKKYFIYQFCYSLVLISAAIVAYFWPENSFAAIISALLFLFTLVIIAALQIEKPDNLWYNARAIAESVKSNAWRWMMKSDPYSRDIEHSKKVFLDELAKIYNDYEQIFAYTTPDTFDNVPISEMMKDIRNMNFEHRLQVYLDQRIDDQLKWYIHKSKKNEKNSKIFYFCSFILHAIAIILLFYRIQNPISLPVEIVVTCASAVLTWGQSKKFKDLNAVYLLAANEMSIIKAEADEINSNEALSAFVLKSENAFTRERMTFLSRKRI
jgi:hypothetical protein